MISEPPVVDRPQGEGAREALHVECEEFVDAILGSEAVASDGDFGLDVVRVLEAAQQSMASDVAER